MENQLDAIAKSYDRGIDCGRKGVNLYDNLPAHIIGNPDFHKWDAAAGGSENSTIKDYLLPQRNMKFVDLGCCLNLMQKGYDQWESIYYGVDISVKTIELLRAYTAESNLSIGALVCGSIHQTPFADNTFDIAACIGVLEYFERDFVEKALREVHRILKPSSKFVLDIPNITSSAARMMMQIEAHLGRPDRFELLPHEFELLLQPYFAVEKKDIPNDQTSMLLYYLTCRK